LLVQNLKNTIHLGIGEFCLIVFLMMLTPNVHAISYANAIGFPEHGIKSDPALPSNNKQSEAFRNSERTPKISQDLITSSKSLTQLGFGTKLSHVSVDDDIGQTDSIISAQALSVFFTNQFIKGTQYLSEVHISNYAFEADASHVGQEVNQLGVRFTVQKQQKFFQDFLPLVGVGFELSSASYKKRHSVDNDGFLVNQYDNTSELNFGILFNILKKWKINSEIDVAAKLEYSLPVAQAVNRISFGFIIFFQPKL